MANEEITERQADLIRRRFQFKDLWSKFGSGFSDEDENYFKQIQHVGAETDINVTYSKEFFANAKAVKNFDI